MQTEVFRVAEKGPVLGVAASRLACVRRTATVRLRRMEVDLPERRSSKGGLLRFLGALQWRLTARESVDRAQNLAYAVLVDELAKSGACSRDAVIEGLRKAEEDARRINLHDATVRQLRELRETLQRHGSNDDWTAVA